MKTCIAALIWLVALPAATAPVAQPPARQVCDVAVDITDTDPKGANVRATPGGAVITALRIDTDGWIEAHVTAQAGDWYEIDRAELNPAGSPEKKIIFHGKGYLHKSVVGVSGLMGGMPIFGEPDDKARPFAPFAQGDRPVDLLGCRGDFLHLRTSAGVGWTRRACTNTLTTCV
jgi:hypothetical protein